MAETPPDVYPVTIVRARYGGSYEPGRWLAFPTDPDRMPDGWDASDVPCAEFWDSYAEPVGASDRSPDQALADLARKLEASRG
jgi:hypothetical protein